MKRFSTSVLIAILALALLTVGAFASLPKFRALMLPNEILPLPVNVDSDAEGTASFEVSQDGMSISYKIVVHDIDKITQAHIHQYVGDGRNGPILIWLYPAVTSTAPGAPTGVIEGRLVKGTFGPSDVRNGFTWEQLLDMMRTGGLM